MKEQLLEVPWPAQGLHVATAFAMQPPGTTPQASNVRTYDPRSGRDRGGQRSGLSKYCPSSTGGAIQNLDHLATTYTLPTSGVGPLTYESSSGAPIGIASAAGSSTFTLGTAGDVVTCATFDSFGNLYVGLYHASNCYVQCYNPAGTLLWTSATFATSSGSQYSVHGLAVFAGTLFVAVHVSASVGRIFRLATGTGTNLDGGTTPWHVSGDGTLLGVFGSSSGAVYNNCLAASVTTGFLGVLTLDASFSNCYISTFLVSTSLGEMERYQMPNGAGNLGDIVSDGGKFFYATDAGGNLVKIIGDVTTGSTAQWAIATGTGTAAVLSLAYDGTNQRLGIVGGANVDNTGKSFATINLLTGAVIAGSPSNPGSVTSWQTIRPSGNGGFVLWNTAASNNVMGLKSDLTTNFGPLTLGGASQTGNSVFSGNPTALAPVLAGRNVRGLAVSVGQVYRFTTAGLTAVAGVRLSQASPQIYSAQNGQQMYYADGGTYTYYDAATDATISLVAKSGALPQDAYGNRARLICNWRNRIVFAGLPFDPNNWFMAAVGDPTNWNYAPSPSVETQAVAGNNSTAGLSPDVINGLVPYSDEILLFLGDHTIYQMTGDPMAGGRIDLVTDAVGGAFGQAWCRDPSGVLYFLSSHGSVYSFTPGALPVRISDPISELLLTLNVGTTIFRMAWNERQRGLHLFCTNIATVGGASLHYFYDVTKNAWWQDSFTTGNQNPLAVHVFDGDSPTDRHVLLGGWDGYIRLADPAAVTDDGTNITSSITLGPIKDKAGNALTLTDLPCDLDTASGTVFWSTQSGQDAQEALTASVGAFGTFRPGRNRSQAVRRAGHAHYVVLSSYSAQAWQLEYLKARVQIPEGTGRQRQF